MNNPIICVDFDGVIHSYVSGWQGIDIIPDDPVPGAIEWIRKHLPVPKSLNPNAPEYTGPKVQIYSSRSSKWQGVLAMQEWFIYHGLEKAYIADDILLFPMRKPAAFLTIDDRAICFKGQFPTTEEMLTFRPWNQQ